MSLEELCQAVESYDTSKAEALSRKLLDEGFDPHEMIAALTETMNKLGDMFSRLEIFLPHLVLAGEVAEPDYLRQCKDLARSLGIGERVIILDRLNDIRSFLQEIDLFVLPSIYEGFARVLMEAAAAGKPIITSDVSGADDAVWDGQSGYILPVNDLSSFVKYISKLLKDKSLSKKMGKKGKFIRKKYCICNVTLQT